MGGEVDPKSNIIGIWSPFILQTNKQRLLVSVNDCYATPTDIDSAPRTRDVLDLEEKH